jgi:hypothetical protein
MHEFGSAGLVTGYIKQLLASFELPTTRIYTKEFEQYYDEHGIESPYIIESFDSLKLSEDNKLQGNMNIKAIGEGEYDNLTNSKELQVDENIRVPYIKDGRIQFLLGGYYTTDYTFVPGKWQSVDLDVNKSQGGLWKIYDRGAAYLNSTKRLQIKNNIYDSYTHEYLGNYLRFLRDYDGLDLMSMYNCFSNKLCSSTTGLDFKVGNSKVYGNFNALDKNYKLYLVPVKLFKNYTIAIDSQAPVEICCGIYDNKLNLTKAAYQQLIDTTYFRAANTRFNQPFLYTALTDLAPKVLSEFPSSSEIEAHSNARKLVTQIADREANLVLMLKIHKDVNSSIVILEGDYIGWNDFSADVVLATGERGNKYGVEKKIKLQHNHTVLANEAIYADVQTPLISPLQLLQFNTKVQMPFADRLLEYLLDLCITGEQDEPRDNVLMAQRITGLHYTGMSQTLRYYIVSKTATALADTLPSVENFIVWGERQFCTEEDDYYLSTGTDGILKLYKLHKLAADEKISDSFTDWIKENNLKISPSYYTTQPVSIKQDLHNGVWHSSLQKLFYRFMLHNTPHDFEAHRDLLGYVDKDVEKYFVALKKDNKTGMTVKKTMINFDTWEDFD